MWAPFISPVGRDATQVSFFFIWTPRHGARRLLVLPNMPSLWASALIAWHILLGVSCSQKPKKQGCDYVEVAIGPEDISVVGITGQ